jgi:hypothetical protein
MPPILSEMAELLELVGDLTTRASEEMAAADARGAGFAGRLRATQNLAGELAEPAERIERLGHAYAAELVKADPAVLEMLDLISEASPEEARGAEEFVETVRVMTDATTETLEQLQDFVSVLDSTATLSRSLRRPLKLVRTGVRGILDGKTITDEWARRAQAIAGDRDAVEGDSANA